MEAIEEQKTNFSSVFLVSLCSISTNYSRLFLEVVK